MGGACGTYEVRRGAHRYLRKRDYLENLGVNGRKILKWIFKNWNREASTGFLWFRIRTVEGACGCGNETARSIKKRRIFD
jgi:hypothetical protein